MVKASILESTQWKSWDYSNLNLSQPDLKQCGFHYMGGGGEIKEKETGTFFPGSGLQNGKLVLLPLVGFWNLRQKCDAETHSC